MAAVCTLYEQAPTLHEQGVHLICCDEKTGMQALERRHPTKAAVPGFVERQEAHYIRHGTQTLIANFEVATGRILAPTLGPTRSEEDFADHVLQTVATDLDGEWIFIVDNLNTHQSESLVHLVAILCDLEGDLGEKGAHGDPPLASLPAPRSWPTRATGCVSCTRLYAPRGSTRSNCGSASSSAAC